MRRGRRWLPFMGGLIVVLVAVGVSVMLRPLSYVDGWLRISLWRAGVRSQYVAVDGLRMHYLEAGPAGAGEGTPLLLVHGLGARGEDWAGLIPGLAKAGFHVYAPDLPGYGRSARPDASYTIAYEEAAVVGFMRAVGISRADMAGWSMGGWVAMRLTADHPEMVHRLVLYDSAGVYFRRDYDADLFTPTDAVGVKVLMARLTPKPIDLPRIVTRDFLRRSAGNAWVLRRSIGGMTSGRDLMEFRLGEIRTPTAVMWGTRDELIPPAAGEKIARGIAGAKFVPIEGCGHLAPAECVAQVLPATVQFLRGGGAER